MITEVQKRLIEERVAEVSDLHAKQTLRSILTNLFEKAKINNWASNELEEKWGFCANQNYMDLEDGCWH